MKLERACAPGVLLLLVCWAAAVAPAALAQGSDAATREQVAASLRLERKLLGLDLAAYTEARARLQSAQRRTADVQGRLDEALNGDTLTLGELESLRDQLSAAREGERTASERLDRQVERVAERMRQIAFLEGESGAQAGGRNSVSGQWKVTIQPQGATGTFDLRLDGAVVAGSYTLDGGGSGSLRGTYAGRTITLQRIDSSGGQDSAFTGTLDPAAGRISGTWQAQELASGQPSSGTWSAVRKEGGGDQQP